MPDLATSKMNYGVVMKGMNKIKDAESLYNESLQIIRGLEDYSPGVFALQLSQILNNLGNLYREQGSFDQALPFLKESIEITKSFSLDQQDRFS